MAGRTSERLDKGAKAPGDGSADGSYAFTERLITAALHNGLARFEEEPRHWDWMLRFLDRREREVVRSLMAKRPPTIRYGYARDTDRWPIIGVVLASEQVHPQGEYLDNVMGVEEVDFGEDGGLELVESEGEIHEQRLDVTLYSDHPDLTLYLYHWAKYTLEAHRRWFSRWVINPSFIAGGEIAPDPRYLPEACYLRRVTWSFAGKASVISAMPDPPRELFAMVEGTVQSGHVGRVTGVRSGGG